MRKFKHKQTGNIAIETHSEKNYKVSEPKNFTVPKWIIEDSQDWEEIIEPKFKNGDIVKNKYGVMYLITDYEKECGYGFDVSGNWTVSKSLDFKNNVNHLKLATSVKHFTMKQKF